MALRALVVLDNATIDALARLPHSRMVLPEVFGALPTVAAGAKPCGSCTGKAAPRLSSAAYAAVKERVIVLPPPRQALLRDLLEARVVRVLVAGPAGKALQYDF